MRALVSRLGRAAPTLAVFVSSLGVTWVGMNACASSHVARLDPPIASVAAADDVPAPPCSAKQAKRTYVGFAEGAGLDSFEASAEEATHILTMLEAELCRLSEAQDREGSLRGAARGGVLSITAVHFTSIDLRTAKADVELVAAADASVGSVGSEAKPQAWAVDVALHDAGWQIVTAAPR